jgi:Flp pilus assembly protein TadB
MPLIATIITLGLIALSLLGRSQRNGDDAAWQAAHSTSVGADKLLLAAARPFTQIPSIYGSHTSKQYRLLQGKLLAAGGKVYAGSVEVFLAVQVTAVFSALLLLAVAATFPEDRMRTWLLVLLSVSLVGWPYTQVNKAIKKRVAAVNADLPSFADLLQMPLAAGFSVLRAVAFTNDMMPEGHVKQIIAEMLADQQAGADRESFLVASEKIGTPEGKAFFTALMQAHLQGGKLSRNLEAQAETLREKAFELRREQVMKLPAKISVITAIHLMPMVLIVAMMPLILSIGDI